MEMNDIFYEIIMIGFGIGLALGAWFGFFGLTIRYAKRLFNIFGRG